MADDLRERGRGKGRAGDPLPAVRRSNRLAPRRGAPNLRRSGLSTRGNRDHPLPPQREDTTNGVVQADVSPQEFQRLRGRRLRPYMAFQNVHD